jgi:hypothetical protein
VERNSRAWFSRHGGGGLRERLDEAEKEVGKLKARNLSET